MPQHIYQRPVPCYEKSAQETKGNFVNINFIIWNDFKTVILNTYTRHMQWTHASIIFLQADSKAPDTLAKSRGGDMASILLMTDRDIAKRLETYITSQFGRTVHSVSIELYLIVFIHNFLSLTEFFFAALIIINTLT